MEVVVRKYKSITLIALVLFSVSSIAAVLDLSPDSSLFVPYGADRVNKSSVRAYTEQDMPWSQSAGLIIDTNVMKNIENSLREKFGVNVLGGYSRFFSETNRISGGYVVYPSIHPLGEFVDVDDSLSLTIRNVKSYPAVDSNMIFDARDDTLTPTNTQSAMAMFEHDPAIDVENTILVQKSTVLVIAEVVANKGCLPGSTDFSAQLKGTMAFGVITNDIKGSRSIGRYPTLPDIREGCLDQAFLFTFVPAEGFSVDKLYFGLDTGSDYFSPDYGYNGGYVWNGSAQ